MNQFVERFRSGGHPATAWVRVVGMPQKGDNVTIGGQEYVFGTHFVGEDPFVVARSLVATINADPNATLNPIPDDQPIKNYYAIFYGRVIRLVATFPGAASNSLSLATSAAEVFDISGSTFSGGTTPGSAIPEESA